MHWRQEIFLPRFLSISYIYARSSFTDPDACDVLPWEESPDFKTFLLPAFSVDFCSSAEHISDALWLQRGKYF